MKEVWLKIDTYEDRKNTVFALANAGYKVRSVNDTDWLYNTTYWVVFELQPENVRPLDGGLAEEPTIKPKPKKKKS